MVVVVEVVEVVVGIWRSWWWVGMRKDSLHNNTTQTLP
jgi:hypothetical protein